MASSDEKCDWLRGSDGGCVTAGDGEGEDGAGEGHERYNDITIRILTIRTIGTIER